MRIKVVIAYQVDPFGEKIGGIETFIKNFIKYSPDSFDIAFIGISSNYQSRRPGQWKKVMLGSKEFDFFPLFFEKDENRKKSIPLSLRFTVSLALCMLRNKLPRGILFFNGIEPIMLFKFMRAPKVLIIHNDIEKIISSESLWSKFSQMYFIYANFVMKSIDHIYVVNTKALEFFNKKYFYMRNKFSFLPTMLDEKVYSPMNDNKTILKNKLIPVHNKLRANYKWILYVGRLQIQKAPIRAIDSFFEYYIKNKESSLIIVGDGNLKNMIQLRIKELKLENNILILGTLTAEVLANLYRASDLLLLTSDSEGMPIAVLEGLGCGLPVVATNVGEVKRVIKNEFSGEVVDSFLPFKIGEAIRKVVDHPDTYSKKNCIESVSNYSPSKVLKPLYEDLESFYTRPKS